MRVDRAIRSIQCAKNVLNLHQKLQSLPYDVTVSPVRLSEHRRVDIRRSEYLFFPR